MTLTQITLPCPRVTEDGSPCECDVTALYTIDRDGPSLHTVPSECALTGESLTKDELTRAVVLASNAMYDDMEALREYAIGQREHAEDMAANERRVA